MFDGTRDFVVFREFLRSALLQHSCALHAYVFMTNHVHLLVTPSTADGVSKAMQCLGRRYVRYFNDRHARTGVLWEGRFRATLIDSERYLFTCHRYIELNPVRAMLVRCPTEYRWTSHAANALGAEDSLISPHERYLALGRSPEARRVAYRALFESALEDTELEMLRMATQGEWSRPARSPT